MTDAAVSVGVWCCLCLLVLLPVSVMVFCVVCSKVCVEGKSLPIRRNTTLSKMTNGDQGPRWGSR